MVQGRVVSSRDRLLHPWLLATHSGSRRLSGVPVKLRPYPAEGVLGEKSPLPYAGRTAVAVVLRTGRKTGDLSGPTSAAGSTVIATMTTVEGRDAGTDAVASALRRGRALKWLRVKQRAYRV